MRYDDLERNQTNNWATNYDIGISKPSMESATWGARGRAYPFADEFELGVVVVLLRKVGEGLNERTLELYLGLLRCMDEAAKGVQPVVPAVVQPTARPSGTPRKPRFYQQSIPPIQPLQHAGTPLPLPPPQASAKLLPPVSSVLESKPLLRSFNTMKELFQVFDRIEKGSYAAARLMEAYADMVVNEACIDCWARHNIVEVGEDEDDAGFVDPFPFAPVVKGNYEMPAPSSHGMQRPGPGMPQVHGLRGDGRLPFSELGSNVRSWGKLPEEMDQEEEENKSVEFERGWRKRGSVRFNYPPSKRRGAKRGRPIKAKKWREEIIDGKEVIIID